MANNKDVSKRQEIKIAKLLNGKMPANSGGTKFGGGDVLTEKWLIEAKTTTKEKTSFSIKKEWLEKMSEQAFEQRKERSALAIQFEPDGKNYYLVDERTFKLLHDLYNDN